MNCETWLVLDSSSPYHGKVLEPPCDSLSHASTVTLSPSALGAAPSACPDWIEYLEQRWFGRTSESKGAVLPRFIADLAMKRVDSSDLEGRCAFHRWRVDEDSAAHISTRDVEWFERQRSGR